MYYCHYYNFLYSVIMEKIFSTVVLTCMTIFENNNCCKKKKKKSTVIHECTNLCFNRVGYRNGTGTYGTGMYRTESEC